MNKIFLFLFFSVSISFGQSPSMEEIDRLITLKEFEQANKTAKNLLAKSPESLEIIEKLGDIAGHQKDWDTAITYYKKLTESSPKTANYHYKYGGVMGLKAQKASKFKALGMLGDIKKAFNTAASLDPKHIEVRWAMVEFYMALPGIVGGSMKKSLKYAEELENISKVDGYLAKGYIYEYDDEPKEAEKWYKKAIEVGQSVTCFQKLTNLYENKTKEPAKAIANIEAAQKVHQRNNLHYQIGKVCAKYNVQLKKGQRCLLSFIENHSAKDGVPIEWAYFRLAQIYRFQNDKENATKWIDKALTERKKFSQAQKEKELILAL